MRKRENIPNKRKYATFSINSINKSTKSPSLLDKVTDILKCLGNGINSATEIAAYCDYSISTVHRLLQDLSELGWVVQDETSHKYFLGSLVHRLVTNVMAAHQFLILHALKEMNILADLTQESVVLGALEQMHIVVLHDIQSPHDLRIIEADRSREMYVGATARVLLSQLDDKELKNFLKHIKIERTTPESITDTAIIFQQIKEIRQKGFSLSRGERIKGAVCICAPVKNYFCPVALYVIGPEDRIKPHLDEYIEKIKTGASRISKSIDGAFNEQGGT